MKWWTDVEVRIALVRSHLENTYYGGEAFPQAFTYFGAAGLAGFFKGAKYELDYVDDCGGEYFVSQPDISGNVDALAHLRGTENLLVDMLRNKEKVHDALAKIQAAWLLASESIYRITRDNNQGGQTIGWLNTWADGRHAQMQSDLSVMISPALFDEFVYPELKEQSAWMDKALYHFDGAEQMKHLDKLLALDTLHMIQWTCVEGQPEPMYYIDALKKVQAAGKGILILAKPEWIEPLMTGLSSRGLYLVSTASSVEQAEELIALVWGSGYFLEDERTVDVRSATCARSWSPTRPGRATFVRFGVSGTNSCRTVRSLMLRNLNAPAKES